MMTYRTASSCCRQLDVSPPGRIQRLLVTLYILSFIIVKLLLLKQMIMKILLLLLIQLKPKH